MIYDMLIWYVMCESNPEPESLEFGKNQTDLIILLRCGNPELLGSRLKGVRGFIAILLAPLSENGHLLRCLGTGRGHLDAASERQNGNSENEVALSNQHGGRTKRKPKQHKVIHSRNQRQIPLGLPPSLGVLGVWSSGVFAVLLFHVSSARLVSTSSLGPVSSRSLTIARPQSWHLLSGKGCGIWGGMGGMGLMNKTFMQGSTLSESNAQIYLKYWYTRLT